MLLAEIKDNSSAYKSILDWVKLNMPNWNIKAVENSISQTGDKYILKVVILSLHGNGRPFSKPDNLIIRADDLKLKNYDLENSDYGNPGSIYVNWVTLEPEHNVDLVKAVQKTAGITMKRIFLNLKPGKFHNLIAATEISDTLLINIEDADNKQNIRTVAIDTKINEMSIGSAYYVYKDPFELQDILIDNGFEAYV